MKEYQVNTSSNYHYLGATTIFRINGPIRSRILDISSKLIYEFWPVNKVTNQLQGKPARMDAKFVEEDFSRGLIQEYKDNKS